jgi:hypothetical protein
LTTITKLDSAVRQLNASINLFFREVDPIVVYVLAIGAATVMSDVLDRRPETSWRELIKSDNNLTEREYRNIINKAWNFFKHGDRDSDDVLDFDGNDNEHIIFYASLECGELGIQSVEKDVFQLWYYATHSFELNEDVMIAVNTLFKNIQALSKKQQIEVGLKVLLEESKNILS